MLKPEGTAQSTLGQQEELQRMTANRKISAVCSGFRCIVLF